MCGLALLNYIRETPQITEGLLETSQEAGKGQ